MARLCCVNQDVGVEGVYGCSEDSACVAVRANLGDQHFRAPRCQANSEGEWSFCGGSKNCLDPVSFFNDLARGVRPDPVWPYKHRDRLTISG